MGVFICSFGHGGGGGGGFSETTVSGTSYSSKIARTDAKAARGLGREERLSSSPGHACLISRRA